MEKLSSNWLTEGLNDFEHKKYLLLAYLQHIEGQFSQVKLYPEMADLVQHYRKLIDLKGNAEKLKSEFPKQLKAVDLKGFQLKYRHLIEDDQVMQEVRQVMSYAEPKFKAKLEEGKQIYDWIEAQIEIDSVGIVPMYKNEGYLLLNNDSSKTVSIYQFALSMISKAEETFRSLQTWFLKSDHWSYARNINQIKIDLIKNRQELPNPAVFLIRSKVEFPFQETLMPITKRLLIQHLS